MVTKLTMTAAAPRLRTLSAAEPPFALLTGAARWRAGQPNSVPSIVDVPRGMRGVLGRQHPTHNSITATLRRTVAPTTDVPTTYLVDVDVNGVDDNGAAKQAAPPRGVPR